jgi:murein DD-endopeptidase MepM/ murein hydrolase activator NlpD
MKKLIAMLLGIILASGLAVAAITVTVKAGDSLGSIAARNNTTVAELQRLNGLKGINIRVGQVLRIPQPSTITVRSGDSLEGIAARYGVSLEALRAANGISGDKIRVGQELKLPSSNTPVSSRRPSSVRTSTKTVIVENGDTLGEIAGRNNVSTADLRAANNLSGDSLRIGQILKLPNQKVVTVKPISPSSTVIVENGDTLGEIAKRNNTSIQALQAANNLSGNAIRVGQVLKLPKAATAQVNPTARVSTTVTIQIGDSLEKIAKRNNISVAALRAANNLNDDAIRVGDTLRLPSSTSPQKSVAIKPSSKPSATKPSAIKPSTVAIKPSSKPSIKPVVSSKPVAAQSNKPVVAIKPVAPTKPQAANTRVIAPPPNLPTATGRTVTIQPQVAQAPKPASKPQNVAAKPVTTAAATLPPIQIVTAPKPQATTASPANVARQPAVTPKPSPVVTAKPSPVVTAKPSPVVTAKPSPVVTAKPSPVVAAKPNPVIAAKPDNMPSTLGFNEPLEIPVTEDSPLIDPALESPFFDATAPESKPTAPSDLAPEDIEIIIPDNQSAASVTPTPDSPTFSRSEKLLWPLSGTMTSRFGWRSLRGNRYHTGIDLAAPKGTRVYAALSGRVEFAGWNRQGYGYLVIIRGWDNRRYYYGHNSRLQVKKGQWVRQGQIISRVGSTGFSTGPHLHFEIRIGNSARNPLAYLPRSRLALASSKR